MTTLHYEFTDETITIDNHTLHRIRATRDLPHHEVKTGDLGGFVEGYNNLIEEAWVADDAKVYENAVAGGKAKVGGNAKAYGKLL